MEQEVTCFALNESFLYLALKEGCIQVYAASLEVRAKLGRRFRGLKGEEW